MPMREQGAVYLAEYLRENPHIGAISSHHLCDTSSIEGMEIIPVYLLRHPIERILSVYNFERIQDSSTPGSKAAKKYTFRDYVKWRMDPQVARVVRNYQTIYLAGIKAQGPSAECTFDTFSAAMIKLKSCLFGLVEKFDVSMIKFEESLKKQNIDVDLSYIAQNVGSENHKSNGSMVSYIAEELGEVFEDVLSNNAYDLALYYAANQLFEENPVKEYLAKLGDFKRRCAQLS